MQGNFSIFLPAVIGLAVLLVFALLHLDRSKAIDPSRKAPH